MGQRPSLQQIKQLKQQFILSFHAWLRVPAQILAAGAQAEITEREQMCAFLERKWHKLRQDISGTLCLINTNHIGPTVALSRVCRETALRMVVWSFADPTLDRAHLHVARDIRPKENAKRLMRDANGLLERFGEAFQAPAIKILRTAIESARSMRDQPELFPCDDLPPLVRSQGVASLTKEGARQMSTHGLDPSIFARQVVDYWLECEAVHTGEGATDLYQPEDYGQGLETDGEITGLARLLDLYALKAMVTAALVNAVGLSGKLPKPRLSEDLAEIASTAERVVAAFVSDPERKG